jgi:UDP-N-acetylglucosamine 4,6-dehydratase
MLNDKNIVITGGTGTFGKACVKYILKNFKPKSLRIISRDELKQWKMAKSYQALDKNKVLRFFIGDVRDYDRLRRGTENADVIIHAAALKQVPLCEYNPIEAIKTNIMGAVNVINAALDNKVEKIIALSTDKASQPINLYGATKLCSDKLFIHANNYSGTGMTKFAVVRYGNVIGSRGSVVPLFKEQSKKGFVTITDKRMTRFWITVEEAVKFVITSLEIMQGRELFVPKIPSMKILDLAKAVSPEAEINIIGIRDGEKLHESLISNDEAMSTYDLGDRYVILPTSAFDNYFEEKKTIFKKVPKHFSYTSDNNPSILSIKDIQNIIEEKQVVKA